MLTLIWSLTSKVPLRISGCNPEASESLSIAPVFPRMSFYNSNTYLINYLFSALPSGSRCNLGSWPPFDSQSQSLAYLRVLKCLSIWDCLKFHYGSIHLYVIGRKIIKITLRYSLCMALERHSRSLSQLQLSLIFYLAKIISARFSLWKF